MYQPQEVMEKAEELYKFIMKKDWYETAEKNIEDKKYGLD
jgi:hypothetical protein